MSDNLLLGLLSSLTTLVVALIGYFGKTWFDRQKLKGKQSFSNVVPRIHEVYTILNTLKRHTRAHRALILRAENNGARPKLGTELFTSVLYEAFDAPLKSVREYWYRQKCDEAYICILRELLKSHDGHIKVKTETLEPSILKDLYEASHIEQSYIFQIAEREKTLLYLSLNLTEISELDPEERDLVRSCVNQLQMLFRANDAL